MILVSFAGYCNGVAGGLLSLVVGWVGVRLDFGVYVCGVLVCLAGLALGVCLACLCGAWA